MPSARVKSRTHWPTSRSVASACISFRRASATGRAVASCTARPCRTAAPASQSTTASSTATASLWWSSTTCRRTPQSSPRASSSPATTCPPCSAWTPSAIASERCRHSASMAVCRIGPSGAMTCRRSMRTSAPHASNLNLTPSAGLIRITASDSMRKRGRCRVTSSVSQSRKDGGCSSATMTSQTVTPTTTSPMTS